MNAIRAAKLPVSGGQAAADPARTAAPRRADAQVIALAKYRAKAYPDPGAAVAAARHPGNHAAAAPLRLTRRGRVAIAAAAALLAAALSLAAALAAQATSRAVAPPTSPAPQPAAGQRLTRVTVRPGDSLWSVAERADPGADPRLVIQQIIRLNGLSGDTVLAGERLLAPRG